MSPPQPGYPPGLSIFLVLRRVYLFNLAMTALGVLSFSQGDALFVDSVSTQPGSFYHVVWILCVLHCGMFTLLPQLWIARKAWRSQPDVNSLYTADGRFMAMPRAARWKMFLFGVPCLLLTSTASHHLFLAVHGSAWGLANLPRTQPVYLGTLSLAIYGLAISIAFEYLWQHIAHQKRRTLEAQKLSAQAQLDLLRSQLDPHLLFNTLSNLYELIDEQPERARAMLLHLIGFLRSTLLGSRSTEQTLSKEFQVISDYLWLMHIRMGDRLQTRLNLPDELGHALVPALLLQPLVENAIQHGLEGRKEGGMLAVTAWRDNTTLVLEVSNTWDGKQRPRGHVRDSILRDGDPVHTGFGLQFVQERLHSLYGSRASVEMRQSLEEQITRATVRLPISLSPTPA